MHTLSLSGIHVTLPCAAAELLICIGGGRAPSPTWFTDLLSAMEKSGITSHILAIDKGVNLCRAVSKSPSLLIGDGDSASPEAWTWAIEHGAEVYRFPVEKDDSDTALSLRIAAQHFTRPLIILTAAFGGRLDHLFSTAAICAHAPVPCILIDEKEALLYLRGGESISIACDEMPRAIFLAPFHGGMCGGNDTGAALGANGHSDLRTCINNHQQYHFSEEYGTALLHSFRARHSRRLSLLAGIGGSFRIHEYQYTAVLFQQTHARSGRVRTHRERRPHSHWCFGRQGQHLPHLCARHSARAVKKRFLHRGIYGKPAVRRAVRYGCHRRVLQKP